MAMTVPDKPGMSDVQLVSVADLRDKTRALAQLRDFYDRIYTPAFPDKEEAEDFEEWVAVFRDGGEAGYTLHPELLVSSDGRVRAGLLWEHYQRSNAVLATYLAVDPAMRRLGAAHRLVDAMVMHVHEMAAAFAKTPIICAELRDPGRAPPDTRREDEGRLAILDRLGFYLLDCAYLQPPLEPGGAYCEHLRLACFPSGAGATGLAAPDVRRFLEDFFVCLARRTGAKPSAAWRDMIAALEKAQRIALLPLATLMPHTDHSRPNVEP